MLVEHRKMEANCSDMEKSSSKELKTFNTESLYQQFYRLTWKKKKQKGILWIKRMGEAHNALKCLRDRQNHQSSKTKASLPRQAEGNRARSALQDPAPWTPGDTEPEHPQCPTTLCTTSASKDSSKSCSGRRTDTNNIPDSLKHIVLELAQELLETWVTWKLPLRRESNTAPNTSKE